MTNKDYRNKFSFVFFCLLIITTLSSCSLPKCEATGHILLDIQAIKRNKVVHTGHDDNESVHWAINKFYIETVIQPVIDKLRLENERQEPLKTREFRKNIQIDFINGTNIISVSYKHSNQFLAEKIVNALMEAYIFSDLHSNAPSTSMRKDFFVPHLGESVYWNEKVSRDIRIKAVAEYWEKIEEMNRNPPKYIQSKKYRSHNAEITKSANSSCSLFRYLK